MLAGERLKGWLNLHIMTNVLKHVGCEVAQLIVPDRGKTARVAGKGMRDGKLLPTGAFCRHILYWPTISHPDYVPKLSLGEMKVMLAGRECSKP